MVGVVTILVSEFFLGNIFSIPLIKILMFQFLLLVNLELFIRQWFRIHGCKNYDCCFISVVWIYLLVPGGLAPHIAFWTCLQPSSFPKWC